MNQKLKHLIYCFLATIVVLFIFNSCEKDNNNNNPDTDTLKKEQAKATVKSIMQSWYYWYDKVPDIDLSKFGTPEEVLDTMMYKTLDKWSFIGDSAELSKLLNEGEVKSYGYFLAQNPIDYNIYVAYVYTNSPMGLAGIKRGFQLTKIGGVAVMNLIQNNTINDQLNKESNSYTFIDLNGGTKEISVSKATFTINTVLYKSVTEVNSKKVGYLVFNSFLGSAKNELNDAFLEFKNAGVHDVILDLRYNGGGENEIFEYLAGFLIPADKDNSRLYKIQYNNLVNLYYEQSGQKDTIIYVKRQGNGLDITNLIVITTEMTASASELVINCLKPYLNLKLVGSKTDGKPVGMRGFSFNGYLMFPITFKSVNSLGEGDYYDGFAPDYETMDNLAKPFGSIDEDSYTSALYYCEHGYFPHVVKSATNIKIKPVVPLKGIQIFSGCY